MRKLKVGIIGAGRIGKVHAESILYHVPEAEVKAISDISMDYVQNVADSLGIPNAYDDYKKILEDPEIDAVLICSSTDTHSPISIEAANAGKHIFCEKPIDYNLERIYKTLDVVEKSGVKYQVGFNRRFDHNYARVNEVIKEGKIGTPQIIKITSRDPKPAPIEYLKGSGGMFFDLAIHDFDMARFQAGSEVEEVYAVGDCLVDPEIGKIGDIDTAVTTLKFENGTIAVIDNSRQAVYGYDQRIEVFGSKGSVEIKNDTATTTIIRNEDSIQSEKPLYFFLERYMGSFVEEIKQFIKAIVNDTEVPVVGFDGLQPVKIAMAATLSVKEKRPVKISEIK